MGYWTVERTIGRLQKREVFIYSRYCKEETVGKQFLGYENWKVANRTYEDEDGKRGDFRVVKRFRY